MTNGTAPPLELEALPLLVECSTMELEALASRLPSPRITDLLLKLPGGGTWSEVMASDTGKSWYFNWRLLMRDYPERDETSLWLHAYDVEIHIRTVDPTESRSPTESQPFAPTTTVSPTTSTD